MNNAASLTGNMTDRCAQAEFLAALAQLERWLTSEGADGCPQSRGMTTTPADPLHRQLVKGSAVCAGSAGNAGTRTCRPVLPACCGGSGPRPGSRRGTCRRCPRRSRACRLLLGARRTMCVIIVCTMGRAGTHRSHRRTHGTASPSSSNMAHPPWIAIRHRHPGSRPPAPPCIYI